MGVVIENSIWEPNPSLYVFILICCFSSIIFFPHASIKNKNKSQSPFSHVISPSFLRFQSKFLFLFSLASVMEGLWSVFGEFELVLYGVSKVQTVTYLCVGFGAALFLGTLLGMLSDFIGHKKACLMFCILHLFVGIWKRIMSHPSIWLGSICLSLATSIFSFSFEAWLVAENKKQGYGQDTLSDTFWLMTFLESASLIGSQVLGNWLLGSNPEKGIMSSYTAASFLAMIGILCLSKGWKETTQSEASQNFRVSYTHIFTDKRMWLLGFAHSCLQFSVAVFWILWAPTLVADGREVHLGLVYPCFLGSRMLGSTVFPWLLTGSSSLRTEDCLGYAFLVLGFASSFVAYDYQEIGALVSVFCVFHAGVGLIIPSLARLRTMHVPNELRGGMISFSLVPANAAILFLLIQRGYYQKMENSTMMAFAALGLFLGSGCMHLLKRWGKQPYQNWHKL
ncbi:molybdate-anion transporter [Ricinus communis]|uniref:molybdate-anion transporter n=1 Tax=Ricinus communis TaxID=3988 RepID=UPI00201ACB73|nr:molybdate-anion transporter [Ricinus communis]